VINKGKLGSHVISIKGNFLVAIGKLKKPQ
jgi:hypothetical protein